MGSTTKPPLIANDVMRHSSEVFEVDACEKVETQCQTVQKLDVNNDGIITCDEFLNGCCNDSEVIDSLAIFDTVLASTLRAA